MAAEPVDEIVASHFQELRRGTVVLACLLVLDEPRYGYALLRTLGDAGLDVEANTLYPLLRRLEAQGLLESDWNTDESRPRKFYRTTGPPGPGSASGTPSRPSGSGCTPPCPPWPAPRLPRTDRHVRQHRTEGYLHEVARRLPPRAREDVSRELRGTVADMVDDGVAQGIPPAEAERRALEELGDPALLAGDCGPGPRPLIGPAHYHDFLELLKILVPVLAGLFGGLTLIGRLFGEAGREDLVTHLVLSLAVGAAIQGALTGAGIAVVVYAVVERTAIAEAVRRGARGETGAAVEEARAGRSSSCRRRVPSGTRPWGSRSGPASPWAWPSPRRSCSRGRCSARARSPASPCSTPPCGRRGCRSTWGCCCSPGGGSCCASSAAAVGGQHSARGSSEELPRAGRGPLPLRGAERRGTRGASWATGVGRDAPNRVRRRTV
ncbi:UNVERIFIED_CONTAM: helix-turn-helix transcriptional regulator [Kocuria sp. CPCC 205316]